MSETKIRSEAEVRCQKVDQLRSLGIESYPSESYQRSHTAQEILDLFSQPDHQLENGQTDPQEQPLKVCGRITSKRDSGSISFIDLRDITNKIQLKIEKKLIPGETGLEFKQIQKYLDEGDFIGAEGIACRTQRGELSIQVTQIKLLSKATIPFPDLYYGVNDPEMCRRHREMDLAGNPDSLKRFILRSRMIQSIRNYLFNNGFYEIETPTLQAIYGGAAARPFITHHNALDVDLYLRIAPELFLKRAVCGGFERVFELGRVFRNEGVDSTHNPEFTALEVYQSYGDYFDILTVVENVIIHAAKEILGDQTEIENQGTLISLARSYNYAHKYPTFTGQHWQVKTMVESVKDQTGLDFDHLTLDAAIKASENLGLHLSKLEKQSLGYVLYAVFDKLVSPQLIQPTFIIDFPIEVSPLAKGHRHKPGFVERFELFINGTEFSNGFSELNDPREQRKRFEAQLAQKNAGDDEAHPMDEDFIQSLSLGLPTCAGMGIGIDRLVMLLTNTPSIRDVVMFPTMKPIRD